MERERLTRLLAEPGSLVSEDLTGLEALARQYPWFSGARLLLAAGERLSGRVMADETLRSAAAHLPSRAALFDLANQVADSKQAPLRVVRSIPEPHQVYDQTSQKPEQAHGGPEAASTVRTSDAATLEAPRTPREPETVHASPLLQQADPAAIVTSPAPNRAPEDPPHATEPPEQALDDTLAAEYMKTAMSQAYDITWQDNLPVPIETASPISLKPATTQSARLRFMDWLASSELTFGGVTRTVEQTGSALPVTSADTQGLDAKALIDRFIRQQPPEIPPKPSFFTPQQAARRSLDDRSGIVTETLARIYAEQGNIPKAREAYERLAMKYPEKSAYFAALSQALEDQQNP